MPYSLYTDESGNFNPFNQTEGDLNFIGALIVEDKFKQEVEKILYDFFMTYANENKANYPKFLHNRNISTKFYAKIIDLLKDNKILQDNLSYYYIVFDRYFDSKKYEIIENLKHYGLYYSMIESLMLNIYLSNKNDWNKQSKEKIQTNLATRVLNNNSSRNSVGFNVFKTKNNKYLAQVFVPNDFVHIMTSIQDNYADILNYSALGSVSENDVSSIDYENPNTSPLSFLVDIINYIIFLNKSQIFEVIKNYGFIYGDIQKSLEGAFSNISNFSIRSYITNKSNFITNAMVSQKNSKIDTFLFEEMNLNNIRKNYTEIFNFYEEKVINYLAEMKSGLINKMIKEHSLELESRANSNNFLYEMNLFVNKLYSKKRGVFYSNIKGEFIRNHIWSTNHIGNIVFFDASYLKEIDDILKNLKDAGNYQLYLDILNNLAVSMQNAFCYSQSVEIIMNDEVIKGIFNDNKKPFDTPDQYYGAIFGTLGQGYAFLKRYEDALKSFEISRSFFDKTDAPNLSINTIHKLNLFADNGKKEEFFALLNQNGNILNPNNIIKHTKELIRTGKYDSIYSINTLISAIVKFDLMNQQQNREGLITLVQIFNDKMFDNNFKLEHPYELILKNILLICDTLNDDNKIKIYLEKIVEFEESENIELSLRIIINLSIINISQKVSNVELKRASLQRFKNYIKTLITNPNYYENDNIKIFNIEDESDLLKMANYFIKNKLTFSYS